MANPELGAKQVCPNCQAKFYDLGKRPAHCPKCHTEFDPDEALRSRRVRGRAAAPEHEAEIRRFERGGAYLGWRTGIRKDGTWLYFIAGD